MSSVGDPDPGSGGFPYPDHVTDGFPLVSRAIRLLRTLPKLGVTNVVRVASYRALLRAGIIARRTPLQRPASGPFFAWDHSTTPSPPVDVDAAAWTQDAERVLSGQLPAFSHRWVDTGFPPVWGRSLLTAVELGSTPRHWSEYSDFDLPGGDIKGYWEASRFDGLLILALGWLASGDERFAAAVERWLDDWCARNPPNAGVQWKCAQETSIRLMNLLVTAHLLRRWGAVSVEAPFLDLVRQHSSRVLPTMLYAIAQDNNHGTSEACALFAAGTFLLTQRDPHPSIASRCVSIGRERLEERVQRLVMEDGSFSQHSMNYHRVLLDSVCFAEAWRRAHGSPPFSEAYYARCRSATRWLHRWVDPDTGDAPNLGANDGSRLFALHRRRFRDFRPSVQWASLLFHGCRAYSAPGLDDVARWLDCAGLPVSDCGPSEKSSRLMADGGYACLAVRGARVLLRLPVFRFRPSHADALHVDLWVGGENVLRDGGSFSYNTEPTRLHYYSGVASHNTIQFDGRDQMPRLSRFLFADWLEPTHVEFDESRGECGSGYKDHRGAEHRRTVVLQPGLCVVHDAIRGFGSKAVMRWRLAPMSWSLLPSGVRAGSYALNVTADVPIARLSLVKGWESRHYGEEQELPVLEIEVERAGNLRTEVSWRA